MFIKIFQYNSPSGLKLPKLHSWMYHTIDSVRFFGAINGFTTETYESLHKEHVKNPYKLSNKRNIEIQLMKVVNNKYLLQYYEKYYLSFYIYRFGGDQLQT